MVSPRPGAAPAELASVAALPLDAALELEPDGLARLVAAAPADELRAHPEALLILARVLEPPLRLAERTAALQRVLALSPDPVLHRAVDAERAIDLARLVDLDAAEALCLHLLAGLDLETEPVTAARATEAAGRVQAWRGTAAASARARELLDAAAHAYAELGAAQWQGSVLFWTANTVHLQRGDLVRAEEGFRAALPLLGAARRAVVLTWLGDLLGSRGDTAGATAALEEAERLAGGDVNIRAYAGWSRARLTSYAGDASTTLRLVEEVDRELRGLAIPHTVATWRADAAEMLTRVGEPGLAARYLASAASVAPDDEFVRLAAAATLALHGDPEDALTALRQVLLEPWLELRMVWRSTLLTAWATLRTGRTGAGQLAARALEQVAGLGGIEVALTTESALVLALLPLAAAAGSPVAARLLHPSGTVVRLLGDCAVTTPEGAHGLPAGLPGELARLVLSSAGGVTAEEAIDALWPDEDRDTGRRRLRQVLSRLGASAPGLVMREGSRLVGRAWVDLVAFDTAATGALASRRPEHAQAALALWAGAPLPMDPYAGWAVQLRERLVLAHVRLLDLLADAAETAGRLEEALRHLEAAIDDDRYDEQRHLRVARLHLASGRRAAARTWLQQAAARLAELGVAEPRELRDLRTRVDRSTVAD